MTEHGWVAPGSAAAAPGPQAAPGAPPGWAPPTGAAPAPGGLPPGGPALPGPPPGAASGGRPAPWASVDFRPGVVPLRALTLSDIFGGVMGTIRGNPAASIGLAFLVNLAILLPFTALGTALASVTAPDLGADADPFAEDSSPGLAGAMTYLPAMAPTLVTGVLATFMAVLVLHAVAGRTRTMGQVWAEARGRVIPATVAVVLIGLAPLVPVALVFLPFILVVGLAEGGVAVGLGIVFFLLGLLGALAIYLWWSTRMAFATSAIAVERLGPIAGMRRSWALTAGRPFWRVLGIRLLANLAVSTVTQIIAIPLVLLLVVVVVVVALGDHPEQAFAAQTAVMGLVMLVLSSLTTPVLAGVDALLYVDQRIRREGFDVDLIRQTSDPGAPR